MSRSLTFWKTLSLVLFSFALFEFAMLAGWVEFSKTKSTSPLSKDDGFEAFQGIAFAREFSEKYQTFDSQSFRSTQTATAFLFSEELRANRLAEIDRLEEKISRRDVRQSAKLMKLVKLPGPVDHFRADLLVDLSEGSGPRPMQSQFWTRLDFTLERTDRTAQNAWGFRVTGLTQAVIPPDSNTSADGGTSPVFVLRPDIATLVRFPCLIENVELPKGTSVRVKLTTLDISELQMKTTAPLVGEQSVRAVCRDRAFTMKVVGESPINAGADDSLVVLKTMTMANSVAIPTAAGRAAKPKKPKTGVERSIEEQLGFVVEEE